MYSEYGLGKETLRYFWIQFREAYHGQRFVSEVHVCAKEFHLIKSKYNIPEYNGGDRQKKNGKTGE